MRSIGTVMVAAALVTATASGVRAEELVLDLDPARTGIDFDVEATGHDVHGVVGLESGRIQFDPATGAASGEIVIDAGGAATGNDSRDRTLREKVFEVARFPKIRFLVERVEGTLPERGGADLVLHGAIDLHGARHPLALPAHVEVGEERVTAETRFEVPFKEWGLKDPSIVFLRVADVVAVHVHADGQLHAAGVPAPAGGR